MTAATNWYCSSRKTSEFTVYRHDCRGGVSQNSSDLPVLYWYTVLYVTYWYCIGTVLVLLHWDSGSFWLELTGAESTIFTGHSSRTRPELGKPHGGAVEFVSLRPLTEFQAQNCSVALGRARGRIVGIMADPPRSRCTQYSYNCTCTGVLEKAYYVRQYSTSTTPKQSDPL